MLGVVGNSLMLVVAVGVVELFAKRVAGSVSIWEGAVREGELSFVVTSSFSLCNVFVRKTTVADKVFDASTKSTGRSGSPRGMSGKFRLLLIFAEHSFKFRFIPLKFSLFKSQHTFIFTSISSIARLNEPFKTKNAR